MEGLSRVYCAKLTENKIFPTVTNWFKSVIIRRICLQKGELYNGFCEIREICQLENPRTILLSFELYFEVMSINYRHNFLGYVIQLQK